MSRPFNCMVANQYQRITMQNSRKDTLELIYNKQLNPTLTTSNQNQQKQCHQQVYSFHNTLRFNPPAMHHKFNGDLFYIHEDIIMHRLPYHYTYRIHNQSLQPSTNINPSTQLIYYQPSLTNQTQLKLTYLSQNSIPNRAICFADYPYIIVVGGCRVPSNICGMLTIWQTQQNIEGRPKDWNYIFQFKSKSEAPLAKDNFFYQYKFQSKLYAQFEEAAIQGSKALIDIKISPLNPMDENKKHIYIYNNIFYSIANEAPFDHSQQKRQDATPSVSAINTDLINLSILQSLDIPNMHFLHIVVISYRGFTIFAQCIIPGILTGQHANCSQYGSIDEGKTIQNNIEFEKLMLQVCQKLHLEDSVEVKDSEGIVKTIPGSPDIKGILGSDGRRYILDLLRLSPRDLNYQGSQNELCVIRPQLIQAFFHNKDKHHLPKINTNIGTQISFIPNENIQQQEQLRRQISEYIKDIAVPQLINALNSMLNIHLTDSKGISFAFHQYGVNLRYLGYVYDHQLLSNKKEIRTVLTRIILVRSPSLQDGYEIDKHSLPQ